MEADQVRGCRHSPEEMRRGRVDGGSVGSRVPFESRVNGLADGLDVDLRKPGELGFWLE